MILYHSTTPEAAAAILQDGFRGASGRYGFTDHWFEDVVFLSVDQADENDGAKGTTVLTVDVAEIDLTEYGLEERGRIWEYVVPAAVLNRLPNGAVTLCESSVE